jgi:transcription initiation factor TFIIIB Brf1 subunit/transcription initiation factor TFIIB
MKEEDILEKAKAKGLPTEKNQLTWKAAAIYLASKYSGEQTSIRALADKFGLTEVTIKNRVKELVSALRL